MKRITPSPKRSFISLLLAVTVWLQPEAQAAFVANPSFESNYNDTWPHVSGIDGWIGGSGVNDRTLDPGGPFHDNGLTPDRNRVAFKQGAGDLAQDISGLTPGNLYWVQFYYNCRSWETEGPLDLRVSFAGTQLDQVLNVRSVRDPNPFRFRNVPFTPAADSGRLTFSVTPYGDQTALFDAVTIVERGTNDLVVANPSFEASGVLPAAGVLTNMAGWAATGTFGVDAAGGAYAENGTIPDQDLVCFIQGEGSITQTISGLVVGQQYDVSFAYNATTGQSPHLLAKAGAATLLDADVAAVGAGNPFHTRTASFTAAATQVALSFAQTKPGSDTVLLDNIRVQGQPAVPIPPLSLSPGEAILAPGEKLMVNVSVPAEALAQRAVDIRVGSDPDVAAITGAGTNGQISLHFDQAGTGLSAPVSGMRLWLKADAITGLTDGAKVAEWADASGFGNHATNANSANQPTFVASGLSGKPTVRFNDHDTDTTAGSVEWLDCGAPVQTKQQPFSAFIVFRSDDADAAGQSRDNLLQPLDAGTGLGRTVLFVDFSGSARKIQSVAAQASLVSVRDYVPGRWTLSSLVQDQAAGVLTLYLDGGLDKTSATGAETGVHGGWRIGATKPGQGGLKGEIAEVLLYDRALSVSEREQVEAYLTARWGLSASRTLEVTGVGRGGTQVEVVESGGWDVANATTVNVTTSFVRNPSFESGGIPSSPGYGSILAWSQTGAGGRNIAGMPFLGSAANGLIPDRDTVAFIQAAGTLSQTVYGLTPGQPYWLQFRYNLRDCCLASGNPPVMDLTVRFAGQALLTIPAIQPLATATAGELNYYFTNVVFTPASASGVLQFAATPVSGDASLLLDGVSIVQRGGGDVVLRNPSFEASGSPAGVGYIQPKLISGWTTELANWGVNIDGEGPFANNGVAQDQDLVLFFQGAGGYVSQNVSGLTAGAKHTLIFALNARQHASNVTRARVSFAGEVLLEEEVTPVGPLNPYHAKYLVFTPAGTEGELKFENASDPSMDSCVVLDNVRLVAGEVGPPVALEISMLPGDIVRLAWPSAATGYNLESAPALSGTWTAVSAQPVVEGNQWVVQLPLDTAPRFFRLKK